MELTSTMKQILLFLFLTLTVPMVAKAQLPSSAKKLVGVWKFRQGSGYETWELVNGTLIGRAYRVNPKVGDTTRVETIRMSRSNRLMSYVMETYNYAGDSVIVTPHNFVSRNRKMRFYNIGLDTPYSIRYKFGFLNRNKLIIKIKPGPSDKPVRLVLTRSKETNFRNLSTTR